MSDDPRALRRRQGSAPAGLLLLAPLLWGLLLALPTASHGAEARVRWSSPISGPPPGSHLGDPWYANLALDPLPAWLALETSRRRFGSSPRTRRSSALTHHQPAPFGTWWGTAGFGAIYIAQRFAIQGPDRPYWKGGILFDDWLHDKWASDSSDTRDDANTWSDVGVAALYTALVADTLLTGNPDERMERLRINVDAVLMNSMANDVFKTFTGRERPNETNSRSFYSGHASGAATAAGLICVHRFGDLEPDGLKDGLVCATAVAGAATTGILRVVANRHWSTDVFTGFASGFLFGYFLPKRWYYGDAGSSTSWILPLVGHGSYGFVWTTKF